MKDTEPKKFKYTGYYRVKSITDGPGYVTAVIELKHQPWNGNDSCSIKTVLLDAGVAELEHLTFNKVVKVKMEVTIE